VNGQSSTSEAKKLHDLVREQELFITATTIGTAVTTKKTVFGVMVHRDFALSVPSPQSEEFMDVFMQHFRVLSSIEQD
jgi:hypothetical protein